MKTILFLLLTLPILAQETHVYDCYQDTMYLWDRPGHGGSYEYYWIQVNNPDQREITLQLDIEAWYVELSPYKYCIEINGVLWTSPWIYPKDQNMGAYGYLEYFNDQLVAYNLDWPDVPLDFHHKQRYSGPNPGNRYEDGWVRGKVKSTAPVIKAGIYSSHWYAGLVKPSCLIQEGLNSSVSGKVKYYDLIGRAVVPESPGYYIKVIDGRGEVFWFDGGFTR